MRKGLILIVVSASNAANANNNGIAAYATASRASCVAAINHCALFWITDKQLSIKCQCVEDKENQTVHNVLTCFGNTGKLAG
jgi:hypothetical protein